MTVKKKKIFPIRQAPLERLKKEKLWAELVLLWLIVLQKVADIYPHPCTISGFFVTADVLPLGTRFVQSQ